MSKREAQSTDDLRTRSSIRLGTGELPQPNDLTRLLLHQFKQF